jgi:hypothetical protein
LLFYRDAAKRIPANVLLQSPWFSNTHKLTNVSNAVATMQQELSITQIEETGNKKIPRAKLEF